MSDTYTNDYTTGGSYPAGEGSGKVDTAKQEASDLKDTARERASDVAGTAKVEAKGVAREVKSQARSLYDSTKRELSSQAGNQQQRAASGLRTLSDDLNKMADSSDNGGIASEFVRQASTRLNSAASWLGDRDPQGLLDEVKSFARRRPAVFIAGSAVLGLVIGRLTRAIASSASDDASSATPSGERFVDYSETDVVAPASSPTYVGQAPDVETTVDTPLYAEQTAVYGTTIGTEDDRNVRSDTV